MTCHQGNLSPPHIDAVMKVLMNGCRYTTTLLTPAKLSMLVFNHFHPFVIFGTSYRTLCKLWQSLIQNILELLITNPANTQISIKVANFQHLHFMNPQVVKDPAQNIS